LDAGVVHHLGTGRCMATFDWVSISPGPPHKQMQAPLNGPDNDVGNKLASSWATAATGKFCGYLSPPAAPAVRAARRSGHTPHAVLVPLRPASDPPGLGTGPDTRGCPG
jgi:hypothetical protein